MTNNTEHKENYLRGIPILLVVVFLVFAKLTNMVDWLYYTLLSVITIVNLFILYKLRKEISRSKIIMTAITIVVFIIIGVLYYYITIS